MKCTTQLTLTLLSIALAHGGCLAQPLAIQTISGRVTTILGRTTIVAGGRTSVTCLSGVAGAKDHKSTLPLIGIDVMPSTGISVDLATKQIGGTKAGHYRVRCRLAGDPVGAWVGLTITPGPPKRVLTRLSSLTSRVDEPVVAQCGVTDRFGNPVDGARVSLLTSLTVRGDRIVGRRVGRYPVRCDLPGLLGLERVGATLTVAGRYPDDLGVARSKKPSIRPGPHRGQRLAGRESIRQLIQQFIRGIGPGTAIRLKRAGSK